MNSKWGAALIALIFAAGFGAGGVFGIKMLVGPLSGWWDARQWTPVAATVFEAQLKESRDDTTTYEALVQYRYEFGGRSYEGRRVGLTQGTDNIGSWQQDHYQALADAQRSGRKIVVWVDPLAPERSVVDRELRWETLIFSIPFAVLFPLISIAALWFLLRIVRAPNIESLRGSLEVEQSNQVKSDSRSTLLRTWCFAVFWNLISLPLSLVVGIAHHPRGLVLALVVIFPLIGVFILWIALRKSVDFVRHGDATISLMSARPRVGEALTVHAHLSEKAPAGEYQFTLVCEQVEGYGEDQRTIVRWRQQRSVYAAGRMATVSFEPPGELPPTQRNDAVAHHWRLVMRYPLSKDQRAFEVILFARSSSADAPVLGLTRKDDVIVKPIPESVATVVEQVSNLRVSFNPRTERGNAIACLVVSFVFGAIAYWCARGSGATPLVFAFLFGAISIALMLSAMYLFTHRRIVEISSRTLLVQDCWLLRCKQRNVRTDEVLRIVQQTVLTTASTTQQTDHIHIRAVLEGGREMLLASGMRDAGIARTLAELFSERISPRESAKPVELGLEENVRRFQRLLETYHVRSRSRIAVVILMVVFVSAFLWDAFHR